MQESARAAVSHIRAHAKELGVPADFLDNHDLHVHVPAGGIPKDGPSAGVTMATAILSAIKNQVIREDVAMTGEITLSGLVLPVGGIREKALAARRHGIKTLHPAGAQRAGSGRAAPGSEGRHDVRAGQDARRSARRSRCRLQSLDDRLLHLRPRPRPRLARHRAHRRDRPPAAPTCGSKCGRACAVVDLRPDPRTARRRAAVRDGYRAWCSSTACGSTSRKRRGARPRSTATSIAGSPPRPPTSAQLGARLVIGDVPPLAFAAAQAAGLPSVAGRQLHLGLDLRVLPRIRIARARRRRDDRRARTRRRPGRSDCRSAADSTRSPR